MPRLAHAYRLKTMTITTEDLAICVLLRNREFTLSQIAEELGVKHNTLVGKCPLFMFAYKLNQKTMKLEREYMDSHKQNMSEPIEFRYHKLKQEGLKLTRSSKLKSYYKDVLRKGKRS